MFRIVCDCCCLTGCVFFGGLVFVFVGGLVFPCWKFWRYCGAVGDMLGGGGGSLLGLVQVGCRCCCGSRP